MSYKQQFNEWRAEHPGTVHDTPQEAGIDTALRAGDIVRYTNDYGFAFDPMEVLGFCSPQPGCVFLDKSSYWFPVRLDQLKPVRP